MIFAVIVTYGHRWHLLREVIASAFDNGINHAVIVNNASGYSVEEDVRALFGNAAQVVTLADNTGSANGYKVGIETALRDGAEYIWLLDDDNKPHNNALDVLRNSWQSLAKRHAPDSFALSAFRPDYQVNIGDGILLKRCMPKHDSFLGFHIADIPYKIWKLTPWFKPNGDDNISDIIRVDYAPYGGFFFHRSVIGRIGLPNPEYVVYSDDNDFTVRLTYSGGFIFLIPASRIDDIEIAWDRKADLKNSFESWLLGGDDFRIYYGARNQVCFELKYVRKSYMYDLNRYVYMAVMTVKALHLNRLTRLKILRSAIHDGNVARLGIHPRYPLS